MSKESKLIKKIIKEYNVSETVFIEKKVAKYSCNNSAKVVHAASIFITGQNIKLVEADSFHHLTKLIFATLDAMGLKK